MCILDPRKNVSKFKLNIDANVKDEPEIKELFERFRDEELLSQCLHGKTQNVKEALNGIIWTKCPKSIFVNRKTLEICVSSAVIEFNEGKLGIQSIFKKAGMKIATMQSQSYQRAQLKRKHDFVRKTTPRFKQRRKDIRSIRKNGTDKNKETEGKLYEAGGF